MHRTINPERYRHTVFWLTFGMHVWRGAVFALLGLLLALPWLVEFGSIYLRGVLVYAPLAVICLCVLLSFRGQIRDRAALSDIPSALTAPVLQTLPAQLKATPVCWAPDIYNEPATVPTRHNGALSWAIVVPPKYQHRREFCQVAIAHELGHVVLEQTLALVETLVFATIRHVRVVYDAAWIAFLVVPPLVGTTVIMSPQHIRPIIFATLCWVIVLVTQLCVSRSSVACELLCDLFAARTAGISAVRAFIVPLRDPRTGVRTWFASHPSRLSLERTLMQVYGKS